MAAAEKSRKDASDVDDDEDDIKEPPKKKGSPVLLIVVIVLLLLVVIGGGAAGAYFFLLKPKADVATTQAAQPAPPPMGVFWPMEPFIVNLIDNEGERYLKIVMQLELSSQQLGDEFRILSPRLRDTILDLLSSKTYKEMMDPIGKQRLREEIVMRMNMNATRGKVMNVYFTEFVIQ